MDEITKGWLMDLSLRHPNSSITLSHQFLDGTDKHECGFIPNNHDGSRVYYDVKKCNAVTIEQKVNKCYS
jgi:hypothetical protein